ncbi:hypothetical protein C2E23DRAFT_733101 [Lenzites betulinus]|nr:hypothetical protein C2E23DRAFT_733101 [Lenzites betulinus]
MDPSSAAEQRATAVAKLKRAASLPRMKDGRRPPMHVEAYSEGERTQSEERRAEEEQSAAEGQQTSAEETQNGYTNGTHTEASASPDEEAEAYPGDEDVEKPAQQDASEKIDQDGYEEQGAVADDSATVEDSVEAPVPAEGQPARPSKRRSRSRSRSRGSRDFKGKAKLAAQAGSASHTNESSADEYNTSAATEDAPPSPPLVAPMPSHIRAFPYIPASRFLHPGLPPVTPLLYPGTTPSTPLPSLDEIQRNVSAGLFRSNSAGAARAMALSRLEGEDPSRFQAGPFGGGAKLMRNNTVAGGERNGERNAVRTHMFHIIRPRINQTDGEQTSGGEEVPTPTIHNGRKRNRRRSRGKERSDSRASTVVDDRDDREAFSASARHTPLPLPPQSPLPPLFRGTPEPPRSASSASRAHPSDSERAPSRARANGDAPYNYEMPLGHRGPVIEDEDYVPERGSPPRIPNLPTTPARNRLVGLRLPHSSDAPSNASTDSGPASAVAVPMFMSDTANFRHDLFPASPFQTPLKETVYPDEDGLYPEARSRSRMENVTTFERGSEISWVAELVQERPLVNDDDDEDDEDDDEEEEEEEPQEEAVTEEPYLDGAGERSSAEFSPISDRPSAPNPLIVDIETSPEMSPQVPESPASPIALSLAAGGEAIQADVQPSPQTYPMRLSVAAPNQLDRSPSAADYATDIDDPKAESTPKRGGEGGSISAWMKSTFTRTGSNSGRRSRTNSVSARERRYNTDSSVSRESGASLNSGKVEKPEASPAHGNGGVFAMQQAQAPVMQSTSSSTSMLSLAPQSAPPGGVSPIPPASSADYLRYADSKLFPFPALKQLEEQRNRARAMTPSASSPDVLSPPMGFPMEMMPSSSSSSSGTTKFAHAQNGRERKLSHQASDSRLWSKFAQPLASTPSTSSHPDYFDLQPPVISPTTSTSGSAGKLPTTRDGVKKWLSSRFKPQSSAPSTPTVLPSPPVESHSRLVQKPSLSDLLIHRENSELSAQSWDSTVSNKSRTPTNQHFGPQSPETNQPQQHTPEGQVDRELATAHSPRMGARADAADMSAGTSGAASPAYIPTEHSSPGFPSPPDPPSSTTPDPQSSLDDFPTRSTSESLPSTTSSSQHSPDPPAHEPELGAMIMERFEETLGRGSKSSLWPAALDDPPRKLVLSSPVLQVANANTVKDRFLFLFTDILIIAKHFLQEHDTLLDATRPDPTDRKFVIKSVVKLTELRLCSERDDARAKTGPAAANPARHPVVQAFVHQFAKDPDQAIAALVSKSGPRDDVALGQLLFRTLDVDRARLGEFLARRSSKVALKAYVDSFGLTGLRIDKSLRVFLQSIHIPAKAPAGHSSPLEYLLDSFASRWYEANAAIVAYDKDLAIRLVRAIVQLNEVMHGSIAQQPGPTSYPKRNVIPRDFVEAFRRFDSRALVSDELLDKIYASVRREKLAEARHPSSVATQPDIVINVKRPLPPRLTYRMQSEPVVLRIPQPDPHLTIQLFGQDLVFHPPVLDFAKSSEVSFRVTGTQLGNKTIVMWRSGPNALAYTGLPLSSPVAVERSFMRNTFQAAFVNHTGLKRRYMFSVDDPLIRHQWTVSLKRQIEIATAAAQTQSQYPLPISHSAEALAFKVLQDTLISPEDGGSSYAISFPSPVDQALARLTGVSRSRSGSVSSSFGNLGPQRRSRPDGAPSAHVRSKSRSQLYRRHGPGKLESELDDEDERGAESSPPSHARIWSLHDLETVCRQNSAIPPVLAYLQVGLVRDADVNAS